MNRSLLKQEAKNQLSKNLGVLILSGLIFALIVGLPNTLKGYGIGLAISDLNFSANNESFISIMNKILMHPAYATYNLVSSWLGLAMALFAPVLTLGIHHVYLKAMNGEKPALSEMFSKMSKFGTSLLASILMGIFIFLWLLLFVVPGIMAAYSYSMTYFVLAEHPELSAMEAINESKRIMKGHRFELFILELSFFWWYLLVAVTFGLAALYVIPYTQIAKANFYNKIKNA